MTSGAIAFLFAAGMSAWVYNKAMHYTGSNTQTSVIVAGVAGVMVFIVAFTLLSFIPE